MLQLDNLHDNDAKREGDVKRSVRVLEHVIEHVIEFVFALLDIRHNQRKAIHMGSFPCPRGQHWPVDQHILSLFFCVVYEMNELTLPIEKRNSTRIPQNSLSRFERLRNKINIIILYLISKK